MKITTVSPKFIWALRLRGDTDDDLRLQMANRVAPTEAAPSAIGVIRCNNIFVSNGNDMLHETMGMRNAKSSCATKRLSVMDVNPAGQDTEEYVFPMHDKI